MSRNIFNANTTENPINKSTDTYSQQKGKYFQLPHNNDKNHYK